MAWTTYTESDQISLIEKSGDWFGPALKTTAAGTIQIVSGGVASYTVTGTGTAFTVDDEGCYIFVNESIAKIDAYISATQVELDRLLLVDTDSDFYILDEQDGEKVNSKIGSIQKAFNILTGIPGYVFPDTPTTCMKESNSLLAFDIYNNNYNSNFNPQIKKEKIGDWEQERFDVSQEGSISIADKLGLNPRIQNCINQYIAISFGGVLQPESDTGY